MKLFLPQCHAKRVSLDLTDRARTDVTNIPANSTATHARHLICAALAMLLVLSAALTISSQRSSAQSTPGTAMAPVDTALVVAVDASRSVDEKRFRLQMDGIAAALEDQDVLQAIFGGPRGRILISLLAYADQTTILLPWEVIDTPAAARRIAKTIRALPRKGGEFTCIAKMFQAVPYMLLDEMPTTAFRTVIDVSGDGIDNCTTNRLLDTERDKLVARGIRINGLPVIEDPKQLHGAGVYRKPGFSLELMPELYAATPMTLDAWYKAHVIGGFGSFLKPAYGYEDFGRAMRQKFVIEISQAYTPQ